MDSKAVRVLQYSSSLPEPSTRTGLNWIEVNVPIRYVNENIKSNGFVLFEP